MEKEHKKPITIKIECVKNGYTLAINFSQYGEGDKELVVSDKALLYRIAEVIDGSSELPQMIKAAGSFTDLIRMAAKPIAEINGKAQVVLEADPNQNLEDI